MRFYSQWILGCPNPNCCLTGVAGLHILSEENNSVPGSPSAYLLPTVSLTVAASDALSDYGTLDTKT